MKRNSREEREKKGISKVFYGQLEPWNIIRFESLPQMNRLVSKDIKIACMCDSTRRTKSRG